MGKEHAIQEVHCSASIPCEGTSGLGGPPGVYLRVGQTEQQIVLELLEGDGVLA